MLIRMASSQDWKPNAQTMKMRFWSWNQSWAVRKMKMPIWVLWTQRSKVKTQIKKAKLKLFRPVLKFKILASRLSILNWQNQRRPVNSLKKILINWMKRLLFLKKNYLKVKLFSLIFLINSNLLKITYNWPKRKSANWSRSMRSLRNVRVYILLTDMTKLIEP